MAIPSAARPVSPAPHAAQAAAAARPAAPGTTGRPRVLDSARAPGQLSFSFRRG